MLAGVNRLRSAGDFRMCSRYGVKAGSGTLLVYYYRRLSHAEDPPRIGIIASKKVGNAVIRNHVKRRLRHIIREHISELHDGDLVVIRALPQAASASFAQLSGAVHSCLSRAQKKVEDRI